MLQYGKFSENPQTEWVSGHGPDRDMVLLRDFFYTDPDGRVWRAPVRGRINGASIPRPLWSTVGSPYTDDYRNASIVHDIACQQAQSPAERKRADKMFYYACLAGGCSKAQARLLYLGVRLGSWASIKAGWLQKLNPKNFLYRLRSQPRMAEEITLRDTFENVRVKLDALSDDDGFEKLEAVVDQALK